MLTEEYWKLREAIRQRLFARLNPEQMKAVETGSGPILCLAGAGSGKTTAMVYRVLHLFLFGPVHNPRPPLPAGFSSDDIHIMKWWLEQNKDLGKQPELPHGLIRLIRHQGVDPRLILAITFTNKAAQEMKDRLSTLLGPSMRDMWVMTFHAACVRILRREITALGYKSDFTIYDADDSHTVVKNVVKELNLDDKRFPPKTMHALISRFKSKLQLPQEARRMAGDFLEEKAALVYEIYQKRLRSNNALDFDDLLLVTVRLFETCPEILSGYQERFRYILVDEYQDTNHVQYVLVSQLAGKYQNICVVGDDDQSIYAFRQADIRNILDFEHDYPKAGVIKLEQNYRSTAHILEAANHVIGNNESRKAKKLWTENPQGEQLLLYRAQDEQDEARFASERITKLVEKGCRYRDFAVLIRTNAQSRVLEEWFIRRSIPYKILGGLKFYERMEIKDIMAYLKLLGNPADAVSLARIINVPRRGIGDTSLDKIIELSRESDIPIYEAVKRSDELNLGSKVTKGIHGFIELMDKLYNEVNTLSVTGLTEKIMHETGYLAELLRENSVEAQTRVENLNEFLTKTQDYEKQACDQGVEPSLAEFLSQVSLVTDLDSYEDDACVVTVMTMHMAKGLEFNNVFLVGLEEGIFPHSRSLYETKELEEERRLCYVALTRARERIFLVTARQRSLYGRTNHNPPSRFLEEIPVHLCEEYKNEDFFRTVSAFQTNTTGAAGRTAVSAERLGGMFVVGDKVEHHKWGRGVVVAARGQGEETELQIAFPAQGIKTLLAKYAPLVKVK